MGQKSTIGGTLQVGNQVQLPETSAVPTSPAAGYGVIWIKDDSPNALMFTDDTGSDHNLSAGGGTNGTIQGTDATYDIQATNEGATAGNARGEYSVDLQTKKSAATQIASGTYSVVLGGQNNTSQGNRTVIIGGYQNNVAGSNSLAFGNQSISTGESSIALGKSCTASGSYSIALGQGTVAGFSARTFTISGTTVTITGNVTSEFSNSNIVTFFDLTGGSNNTLFSTTRTITSTVTFGGVNTTFTISSALDDRTGGKCASQSKGTGSFAIGLNTTGTFMATGPGAFVIGRNSSGSMISSEQGSIILGASLAGTMTSSGIGSFAGGSCASTTTASGSGAFAFGRSQSTGSITATGIGSVSLGYSGNSARLHRATQTGAVALGKGNTASQEGAAALGRYTTGSGFSSLACNNLTTASGNTSFACGYNTVASTYQAFACGSRSIANKRIQFAHGGGRFSSDGDAQTSQFVLRAQTTNNTPTEMLIDGTSRLSVSNNSTWAFDIILVARRTDADNEGARYTFEGAIDKIVLSSSTALIGAVIKNEIEDTAAWDADVDADTTNGALRITVTGENSKTINWVAFVRTVETSG